MSIQQITGPACTHCACQDTEEIAQREWFGSIQSIRRCRRCGTRFHAEVYAQPEEAIPVPAPEPDDGGPPPGQYVRGRQVKCTCPDCERENPPVTRTMQGDGRVIRYHRCQCGFRFKTLESVSSPGR